MPLSWVRRDVFPSIAIRSCRPGHNALIQSSKQRPKRIGSTRFTSVRSQRSQGMSKWNGENCRRKSRWLSPQAAISSKSSQSQIVAQVNRSSTSESGYMTRQGSRSSSRREKCVRRTANRDRGISSPARRSNGSLIVGLPRESVPQRITHALSRQIIPLT